MKKSVIVAAVAAALLTSVVTPVVASAAEGTSAPSETLAEQVARIHKTGDQAVSDAEAAKPVVERATGRAGTAAAVRSIAKVKLTGKSIMDEAQKVLDANSPELTIPLSLSTNKGMSAARKAVEIADQTFTDAANSLHDNGFQVKSDAETARAVARNATTPEQAKLALEAADRAKLTGQRVDDRAQGLFDGSFPKDSKELVKLDVLATQGMSAAQEAIKIADEAIAIAQPKADATPGTSTPGTPAPAPSGTPSAGTAATPGGAAAASGPQVKIRPRGRIETGGGATAQS
ncbi:hypothetical protein [Amycolatopsis samaneae]|uniref:Uncharacterized protein n=1 Tax=Amycolatopsis samaneae TaxID=664691 RepID=A0ABW5GAK8_9PSEU